MNFKEFKQSEIFEKKIQCIVYKAAYEKLYESKDMILTSIKNDGIVIINKDNIQLHLDYYLCLKSLFFSVENYIDSTKKYESLLPKTIQEDPFINYYEIIEQLEEVMSRIQSDIIKTTFIIEQFFEEINHQSK